MQEPRHLISDRRPNVRKKGRPPEDRLGRQRELFQAVAPLIEKIGARRLTMRAAADAAHMSLGGLYHYFPSKRDLVLHALKPEAFTRLCHDFFRESGHLRESDPQRFLEAYVDFNVRETFFIRPALWAAMELGATVLLDSIRDGIAAGLQHFIEPLRQIAPDLTDPEGEQLGRSLRRSLYAAALDREITREELRDEQLALIEGVLRRRHHVPVAQIPDVVAAG